MAKRNSGRLGKLVVKFRELAPAHGDELLVGILSRSDIVCAASRANVQIQIFDTDKNCLRGDGKQVPIFLVKFQ